MKKTYGQLKENNGMPYNYEDFEKEVASRLKQYVLVKLNSKHVKLCRKLFRQGYTVADTVGMLILNS
jgi:hypothetical protein